MRRFFVFLTVVFLLMPSGFLGAQESADAPSEEYSGENVLAPESEEAAHEEDKAAQVDAVSSASFVMVKPKDNMNFLQRFGIALAIVAVQAFLIWLVWHLFKLADKKLEIAGKDKIKPLVIKKFRILTTIQIVQIIQAIMRILKYVITAIQLYLAVPIVFSFFSTTKDLASKLFGYILDPLKNIGIGILEYIPNLVPMIFIIIIARYVLRGLKFFANQIERGKLVIPHFYSDWAAPTYKILQVLLWAFTVALVYPYLPGSNSRAFQGVSVFVGIIFSFGSTTAIGNLVAGLVITYMRPFKIGDRVQIKEITGFVVEKNLMVVRLKTHKNEYVTFPNLIILGSSIINYNTSSDEDEEGLIIFTEITFGYDTPWQTVHDILINAALATDNVLKRPKPFVLQTKLDDFYACYQINCYTKDVSKIPAIYAMLYENIQNGFREAGLDMTAAHYRVITKNGK
jgi:small-conductance mechanosensitive channel